MVYMAKKMVIQSRKRSSEREGRILVHCSAGRGRTGTLIACFLMAEHLLNMSETVFLDWNMNESGFRNNREEPDNFYTD